MLKTSSKVRRLEKEAVLRAKTCEQTREESNRLLSKLNIHVDEDEDTERHRRQISTRPIRRIQKELEYPVEQLDKLTERIQQELKKKQALASASTTNRAYHSSLSSSSGGDRLNHDDASVGKYASKRQTTAGKQN